MGTIVLLIATFFCDEPLAVAGSAFATSWAAMLWMALVGSVLAYLFWQAGIKVCGPGAPSVLGNLVPVAVLVIAVAFGRMPQF